MLWLNTLGNLNYQLGPLIYLVPMYAVYVGALDRNDACERIRKRDQWLCFVVFLLTCLLVYFVVVFHIFPIWVLHVKIEVS